jgi:hypothetical protein
MECTGGGCGWLTPRAATFEGLDDVHALPEGHALGRHAPGRVLAEGHLQEAMGRKVITTHPCILIRNH